MQNKDIGHMKLGAIKRVILKHETNFFTFKTGSPDARYLVRLSDESLADSTIDDRLYDRTIYRSRKRF